MDPSLQVTVILCTYNRARALEVSLQSLCKQELPQGVNWEIVVVDNNSKDETANVVEAFRCRFPGLVRYVFESQQGVSMARNAGIREARGEIIAFIDDDETPEEGWLENLTAHLQSGDWAGAGGRVVPTWECPAPRWWSPGHPFMIGPLAAFEADPNREELSDPPFGANMAFRKEVFLRYGGFRSDLGRCGNRLLGNEDTEFGRRLFAAGERLRYEPRAVTNHPVEPQRLKRGYFLEWWFNKGRSDVLEGGIEVAREVVGGPLRLSYNAAIEAARWVFAGNPPQRFICHLKIWAYAGQAVESYCQMRDAKRRALEPRRPARTTEDNAN